MNKRKLTKLVVVALSASATAFFTYSVYKTYKQLKEQEEMALKGEELKKELDYLTQVRLDRAMKLKDIPVVDEEDFPEDALPGPEHRGPDILEEELDEDEPYIDGSEGGLSELRYEPSSPEALDQYKHMKLAEFDRASGTTRAMMRLFDHPFKPTTGADEILHGYLVSDRELFFGPHSVHTNNVSIADLILYEAQMADFDIDNGVEFWVNEFLFNLGITAGIGEVRLEKTVDALLKHEFYNDGSFGMFGLDEEQVEDMYERCSHDDGVNFSKQYNIWLERQLEHVEYEEEDIYDY